MSPWASGRPLISVPVIINIIPNIKCPRGFNFREKNPEGYFHGFKWIK
jgi:hypothetical protein